MPLCDIPLADPQPDLNGKTSHTGCPDESRHDGNLISFPRNLARGQCCRYCVLAVHFVIGTLTFRPTCPAVRARFSQFRWRFWPQPREPGWFHDRAYLLRHASWKPWSAARFGALYLIENSGAERLASPVPGNDGKLSDGHNAHQHLAGLLLQIVLFVYWAPHVAGSNRNTVDRRSHYSTDKGDAGRLFTFLMGY